MPGAVAVAGGRVLLTEPASQPQPVAALIQALVPASEVPIPATRQTGLAGTRLLPDVAGTAGTLRDSEALNVAAKNPSGLAAGIFCDTPPSSSFLPRRPLCEGVMR